MSDDLREEMRKLKEEMASLKDQLREVGRGERRHRHGLYVDIEGPVHDYMDDVMQSVAEGVHGELEKSIFIGPGGTRIVTMGRQHHGEPEEPVDIARAAGVMSALGNEHRLRILNALMAGGKYINELQEKLSEITTSTLSSHLNVLEEAGLVVQEKMRGRYLITMPGRTAYKMAAKITSFVKQGEQQ
ncbi:MAG: metalloregulator ArsR/SmtB family transcription factor [Candidatus Bathyarchaeia archaeon]|jgi:DNA-binding HxlR family transcriptional regulator